MSAKMLSYKRPATYKSWNNYNSLQLAKASANVELLKNLEFLGLRSVLRVVALLSDGGGVPKDK